MHATTHSISNTICLRSVAVLLCLFSCQFMVQAQRQAIVLEALGAGGYYSLNYVRFKQINEQTELRGRIGASINKLKDFEWTFNPDIKIPISIGIERGRRHVLFFEIGSIFNTYVRFDYDSGKKAREHSFDYFLSLGYKHKFSRRLFATASYNPILTSNTAFYHWGGVGIGYTF